LEIIVTKELPNLSSLVNLRYLDCYSNQLEKLPDLSSLVNLTHLYFQDNQVSEFPDLSSLVNLKYLSIDNNQLTNISEETNSCRSLKYFTFSKNPFNCIPQSVQNFISNVNIVQQLK
jgi:Leucine-rich repeat (LRR) protein